MANAPMAVLSDYLNNVQVNLQTVQYSKVSASWGSTVHVPEVCRLYYFREGRGWITIRNRTYRPTRGQLYLLPAGQTVTFDTDAKETFGKYWCHFTATVGDVNLFQFIDLPHFIDIGDEAKLEGQFHQLIHLHQNQGLTSPLRIKSLLLDIISMYVETAGRTHGAVRITASTDMDKINTLLMYIEDRLQESISIQELANLVHFHPQYLSHYFKTMMGASPVAYINQKRIERVKRLLAESSLSVSEIARDVGWEGHYLSRLFKRSTGLSPSDYRKSLVQSIPEAALKD